MMATKQSEEVAVVGLKAGLVGSAASAADVLVLMQDSDALP